MNLLFKLSEQGKNLKATKMKNKVLKQVLVKKLADPFETIEKITRGD